MQLHTLKPVVYLLAAVFVAKYSEAVTIDIPVAADGELIDNGKDGTFDSIRQIFELENGNFSTIEFRTAMEFDLRSIPAGSELIAASFVGYVSGTGTPSGVTELSFDLFGYRGDGQITLADSSTRDPMVGSFTIPAGFPVGTTHIVSLDRDYVAARLTDSDYLGLLTRTEDNAGSVKLRSGRTSLVEARPVLRLTLVPEPGAAVLALVTATVVFWREPLLRSKRRVGSDSRFL